MISLPRLEGRRIAGIPHDPDGFVGVDEHGRAIGLRARLRRRRRHRLPGQAGRDRDAAGRRVAEAIAAEAGAEVDPQPFDPILRGVLWTGREPRYLYGRPTGGHGEMSSLGEQPQWPPRDGKVIGRYLTSFVDSLADDADHTTAVGSPSALLIGS